ncbi:MAG: regulatory signaling modulator protein AmpE [Pseudomonadota bacterium]
MSFLAIVLALAAERAFPHGTALGESRLLATLLRALRSLGGWVDSAALPWLLTLAGAALTALIGRQIHSALGEVIFTGVVLFLCLGPRDLGEDVQRLITARSRGDADEVARLSLALQSGPAPDESHQGLIGSLFIQSHERLFGVLLWCVALGPAGAVGYRLASRLPALLAKQDFSDATRQAADQLHALAAWLPARLSAGLFALAGSMDDALESWRQVGELNYSGAWRHHTWAVLAEVSTAALAAEEPDGATTVVANLDAALREVLRMQTRALLLLLAGFAVYAGGTLV